LKPDLRIILILFGFLLDSCNSPVIKEDVKSHPEAHQTEYDNDTLTYRLIYEDNVGWGYQIFEGGKMIIDQKHIPAEQGLKGFGSKSNAEVAARYIVSKIKRGIFPPTLTHEELDSLHVLN
jgi:hypothetical protein